MLVVTPLLVNARVCPATQLVGLLHWYARLTLTVAPLAKTAVQAPVLVSVRTACSARLCVEDFAAIWVPIVIPTLPPFVMRTPDATKLSGGCSEAFALPDFCVTLPAATLIVTVSAYVSLSERVTAPLSAMT